MKMRPPRPPAEDEEDRTADRVLYESFVQRAERDRSPARRRMRRAAIAAAFVVGAPLVVGGGAVATKAFLGDDKPVTESKPGSGFARSPADRRSGAARAKDPDNSTVWGVRLYFNKSGDSCVLPGAVGPKGDLGRVKDGKFMPFAEGSPGECHDMRDHLFVASRTFLDVAVPRTVLFGVTDRSVQRLELVSANGERKPVPVALDGSYVLPLPGRRPLSGAVLIADTADGPINRPLDP
jgi:hypothetical protein